mmetsp:Transcript_28687/g.63155  ORF Transcript_28687/g.63155 Transcript_28687/m.63155 type:complete len:88 (+) Transcript_28687:2388-2651(+)
MHTWSSGNSDPWLLLVARPAICWSGNQHHSAALRPCIILQHAGNMQICQTCTAVNAASGATGAAMADVCDVSATKLLAHVHVMSASA